MSRVEEVEKFLRDGRTVRDETLNTLAARLADGKMGRQRTILKGLQQAMEDGRLEKAPRGGYMPARDRRRPTLAYRPPYL